METNLPSNALKVFLTKIIDYAGLYPPANLALEEAIRNFVRYQNDSEVWMLSRFILPARRLHELSHYADRVFSNDVSLSFSALGRGGRDTNEVLENLRLDIADILAFREMHDSKINVDMFELPLPASVLADQPAALAIVNRTTDVLNKNGLSIFFEAPFGEGWRMHAEKVIRSLRKIKDKHAGFKLRTGGVTADAFPAAQQVAWAIAAARDAGVPMKATAGLHHPIRHYNDDVGAKMFGFINVFGAGILANVHNLAPEQIQDVLEDENAQNFIFDESGFSWKNLRADLEQITSARHKVTSFGSCSFDEPRQDLQKLGLM
jgi:hypothetical protein